jgi:nucleoside-diphosphate-sugar epimerase
MAHKNILITGAAGFLGPQLAARLLNDISYKVYMTDLSEPSVPGKVAFPENCVCIKADLCDSGSVDRLLGSATHWHAIFIFHGIMSVGSEENPDLSMKVNIDATRALLLAISKFSKDKSGSSMPRVIYASSQAVYGPPYTAGILTDDTPATPDGVYGSHKLMMEIFINDLHRRGLIDAYSIRLPTVVVRPGAPSRAASAFLSGLIREPMAGLQCIIPTLDRSLRNTICSPRVMVENFLRMMQLPSDGMPPNVRAVQMPAIVVTVQEMMDALAKVAGEDKLKLLKEEEDEEAERLLKGWPQQATFDNAKRLGLLFDDSVEQMFREYVDSLSS